jgi:hypothetical protein
MSKRGEREAERTCLGNRVGRKHRNTLFPEAAELFSGAKDECTRRSGQQEPFARAHGAPLVQTVLNTGVTTIAHE